ncbi:MAG: hypothetical protein HON90_15420 [Halobacteriovoraceae bacterium]|nr:hypothetical protein [Halobacteriovoraceae bacterium]
MSTENEFLHDIVNKITIAYSRLERIERKLDKFSKEEVVEMVTKARVALDSLLELINERKSEIGVD